MSASPAIDLDEPVPAGVLCDDPASGLEESLAGSGAVWWQGASVSASGWSPRLGDIEALPTDPNTGDMLQGEHRGQTGLQCQTGIHCGFVADNALADASTATLAVRWVTDPGAEARTLLTLNTGGAARKGPDENYLFLSETEGKLTAQDDAGTIALNLPCPPQNALRLAVVELNKDHVTLILGDTKTEGQAIAPILHGPGNLFIAARNHRPKLLKTLGAALILDVFLWPGVVPPDTLTALRRYHLWAGG